MSSLVVKNVKSLTLFKKPLVRRIFFLEENKNNNGKKQFLTKNVLFKYEHA